MRLIDGTGAASRQGDRVVADDRVLALGLLADTFITCNVSQDATTVVTGNCRVSLASLTTGARPPSRR